MLERTEERWKGAGADTVEDEDRQAREAGAPRDEQGSECGGDRRASPPEYDQSMVSRQLSPLFALVFMRAPDDKSTRTRAEGVDHTGVMSRERFRVGVSVECERECGAARVVCLSVLLDEKRKANTHRGARTHDHTIKSRALYRLS